MQRAVPVLDVELGRDLPDQVGQVRLVVGVGVLHREGEVEGVVVEAGFLNKSYLLS